MKNKIIKTSLIATSILFGFNSFSQKLNETSAALEYKKYEGVFRTMMTTGEDKTDEAKKILLKAKSYIDLAAENETTKNSPKTLFYKGEIYTGLLLVTADDSVYQKENADQLIAEGLASYKKAFEDKKFKSDIRTSIFGKKFILAKAADTLYKTDQFKEAGEIYEFQVKLSDAIGEMDSISLFNSGLSADRAGDTKTAADRYKQAAEIGYRAPTIYAIASSALRKDKRLDEAKAIITAGQKKYPNNKDILFELVNMNLEAGDNAAAEASLNAAIEADPTNKQLYMTIGTIYFELKEDKKAEAALLKALEIDPNYSDALYQLGAMYTGNASNMKQEASQLKNGDPKYDVMLKAADEINKKAVPYLEKYIELNPKDKQVLMILSQLHRSLKNPEKSAEYKKRADAL
ncbi:MAG: tetratricopeptide repeat protein [Crocinitomicaceae bacterium]|nr:tetratricopeptide repeat protein [Crocinitomicaceae bacterium]